jgi:hypothetical protein
MGLNTPLGRGFWGIKNVGAEEKIPAQAKVLSGASSRVEALSVAHASVDIEVQG